MGDGFGVAFGFAGSSPVGVGVDPGPTVGEGFGSDGFRGVGVAAGVGVGSDGSTGVGVIFGSTGDGVGSGVASGSAFDSGVIIGTGVPFSFGASVGSGIVAVAFSFVTVVAMIPEIKNNKVVIAKIVFLNIFVS